MKWKSGAVLALVYLLLMAASVGVWAAPAHQDDSPAAEHVAAIRAFEPTVIDDFSTDEGGWTEDADDAGNRIGIVDDAYALRIETPADLSLLAGVSGLTAENFLFEIDAVPVELYGYSETGLVFRSGPNESYLFLISSDSEYALIKADSGELEFVVEATVSPAIEVDDEGAIRLGVLADGDQISLLVNGEVLITVEDPNPIAGELGVFITASDAGPLEVVYDNFTLWDLDALPAIEPTATPTAEEEVEDEPAALAERLADIRAGDPLFSDDFSVLDEDWVLEGDSGDISLDEDEGVLLITSLDEDGAVAVLHAGLTEMVLTDYLAEVEIAPAISNGVTDEFAYGLTAGVTVETEDAIYYYYWIVGDGYVLAKWSDEQFSDAEPLIPLTPSDALDVDGGFNRLGMLVEGDRITLLINDEVVDQIEDSDLEPSSIALSAYGATELLVDNITVWPVAAPESLDDLAALTHDEIHDIEPTYFEDFDSGGDSWTEGGTSTTFFYDEGAGVLYAEIDEENRLRWVVGGELSDLEPADFLVELETQLDRGDGNYGLVFRMPDADNYYLFTIWDGAYSLRALVEGEWQTLIDWTESEEIETGRRATNRLGVLARGENISLLVNDVVVDEIEDATFAAGSIGIAAGTFDNGRIEVTFDDFTLWILDASAGDAQEEPSVADQVDELHATDPVYEQTFRRAGSSWEANETDEASLFTEGGAYHIAVESAEYLTWYISPDVSDLDLADYLVEVDVWTEQQALDAEYGLIFRYVDGDNFYWFTLSDGWYSVYKKVAGEWTALIDWTESDAILPEEGDLNRIGVLVEGGRIAFLINDKVVAGLKDDSLSAGSAGVAAGTFDEGGLEAAFDNFTIWTLDAGADTDEIIDEEPAEAEEGVEGEEAGDRGGR